MRPIDIDLKKLTEFIKNDTSLLKKDETLASLKVLTDSNARIVGNLMFGTGICSKANLSKGIPFDILSMFLMAKKIQQQFPGIGIINILADSHAANTNKFSSDDIFRVTKFYKKTLTELARFLKIQNYKLIKSSSYQDNPIYKEIYKANYKITAEYEKRQASDLDFLRQEYNVVLKLGWSYRQNLENRLDETYFDKIYKEGKNIQDFGFIYIEPGKRISRVADVVPYTIMPKDINRRVLLGDTRPVRRFISKGFLVVKQEKAVEYAKADLPRMPDFSVKQDIIKVEVVQEDKYIRKLELTYINYLKKIIRLFDNCFPNPLANGTWDQRLDKINNHLSGLLGPL